MYGNIVSRSDSFPKVYSRMMFISFIQLPFSAADTRSVTRRIGLVTAQRYSNSTLVVEPILDRNLVARIIRG